MKKEDALRYLSETRSLYGSYHNHKETSAWAGIVLFGALIPQSVSYLGGPTVACGLKSIETISVLLLFTLAVLYVQQQFKLRRTAANLVAACFALSAEILIMKDEEVSVTDFTLEPSVDKNTQPPDFLPKPLRDRANKLDGFGSGPRKRLEFVGYFVLIASVVLALVRIWWPSDA